MPPLAESVWNTIAHLDGGVAQVARAAGASQISIYWPRGAGGRRERWRGAQYGWFIFTWPHSLTPANVSALRKSLKIIKKLMSLIEMCSAAGVRTEVDWLLVRNVARWRSAISLSCTWGNAEKAACHSESVQAGDNWKQLEHITLFSDVPSCEPGCHGCQEHWTRLASSTHHSVKRKKPGCLFLLTPSTPSCSKKQVHLMFQLPHSTQVAGLISYYKHCAWSLSLKCCKIMELWYHAFYHANCHAQ